MMSNLQKLSQRLRTLTVFRALTNDPVVSSLISCLDKTQGATLEEKISAYAEFVSRLYGAHMVNLSRYIKDIIYNDENIYIKSIGRGEEPSKVLSDGVLSELEILQELADLTPEILRGDVEWDGYLPAWENEKTDVISGYRHRIENIEKYGYGIYAAYHMFYVDGDGRIVPVKNPDGTRLSDLIDYDREKKVILDNTRALLSGKPAANVLLTGDAGTGKSSTVKAVVNELYTEGLRILEVRKEQLHEIPAIIDELNSNPLKFILFIDDLSFAKDDDNFSALKAILEGSVSAKSQNVVIYATSNRRHLVKEKFSDREGDDVHVRDTMQEIVSLSERFGIHLSFSKPDKKTYLNIVHHLADCMGIEYDEAKLDAAAERFALSRSSRSARAAKQFADSLLSGSNEEII